MSTITFESATALAEAVRTGDRSPVELVDAFLDRIGERNDDLNAYVNVLGDDARERAREAERAVENGADLGPLHGVPVAIKDLHFTKTGVPHTMGCAPLSDNVAAETSIIVERLEAAGAIVLGTTNTPELGHTMRTYNELVGPTPTPFDPDGEINAGGSSGGSAAALADGLCALATGSDVGGSLRNPASPCNIVSVKPTFGLVPKDTRPDAFSSHTPVGVVGPMARTVDDLALMLSVMVGPDGSDPFSVPEPSDDYRAATDRDADEFSVAFTPDLDTFPVHSTVTDSCRDAMDALADAGATVADAAVDAPSKGDLNYAYGSQATPLFALQSRILDQEFGVDVTGEHADQLSDTFVNTVRMGEGYDAVDYLETNQVRTELYDAVEAVFDEHDALVMPTLSTPPLTHDEPFPTEIEGQSAGGLPMDWGLTWPFNLTGHPVVNAPAGLTDDGLPVGLQIVGPRYAEADLLGIAAALEDANPWAGDYPGNR
ncbi:amidase [Halorientalis marina]|jgi:Asp-tRNA(Asn)/Glu-tRNA(Gln) amidotransferase A subunit family amidase|uniref:amidase n=1 Tax=Halorientalis marina TaxID=2931976 RepID=UPI001FF3A021|nr:amidase [Halorientalis marina]